jgi:uncharacterized membrane protein
MKLAAVRAAMWFFGTFLVVMFLFGQGMSEKQQDEISDLAFIGYVSLVSVVVAGLIFFKTLYDDMTRESDETTPPKTTL